MASSKCLLRRISTSLNSIQKSRLVLSSYSNSPIIHHPFTIFAQNPSSYNCNPNRVPSRIFCSQISSNVDQVNGPTVIDYSALLNEDEFHKLADATIHDLLEKIEEYGDSVDIDGFDIDFGNQVLTVKFGSLGTYVLNKQTPNRQIWMSSPVSGPSRFDWDRSAEAWIYRRTKAKLIETLENEIKQLCSYPIKLS